MTVVELIPQTQLSFPAPWAVVGAATAVDALTDDRFDTYIQWNAGGFGQISFAFDMTTVTLGAFQAVAGVRLRMHVLGLTYGSPSVEFLSAVVAGPNFTARLIFDPDCNNAFAVAAPFDCHGPSEVPGILFSRWWSHTSGVQWTQSDLNSVRFQTQASAGGSALLQIAEAAIEVDIRTAPSVNVLPGVSADVGAQVVWETTDEDGDPQGLWEFAVFTPTQAAVGGFDPATSPATYRQSGTGATQAAVVAATLTAGSSYVTYVRAGKIIGLDDNSFRFDPPHLWELWGDWGTSTLLVSEVETTNYVPTVSEGSLGCHDWAVLLQTRGGIQTLAEIPWTSFSWARELTEVSDASVTFPRDACDVVPFLTAAAAWEHELAFWRDTSDPLVPAVEEWVGPIVGRNRDRDNGTITWRARDLGVWFEHRLVHGSYTVVDIELATIFAAYAIDALGPDNSMGIQLRIRSTSVPGSRTVEPDEYRRAADLMRDIGRSGVDWTMIGRTLLGGGLEIPLDQLKLLIDEHMTLVRLDETGESSSTHVTVIGRLVEDVQSVGTAEIVGDPKGVLETAIQANEVEDDVSATSYAEGMLGLLTAVPKTLSATLKPESANGLAMLIPGARFPVNSVELPLIETLRLKSVSVDASRGEDGITENVTVVLQSLGLEE